MLSVESLRCARISDGACWQYHQIVITTVLAVSLENCFSLQSAINKKHCFFDTKASTYSNFTTYLSSLKSWIFRFVASVSPLPTIADVDMSILNVEKLSDALKHTISLLPNNSFLQT